MANPQEPANVEYLPLLEGTWYENTESDEVIRFKDNNINVNLLGYVSAVKAHTSVNSTAIIYTLIGTIEDREFSLCLAVASQADNTINLSYNLNGSFQYSSTLKKGG